MSQIVMDLIVVLTCGVVIWAIQTAIKHVSRGYITRQEYADFIKYLYEPYRARDGNGTAERLKKELDNLPIKEE